MEENKTVFVTGASRGIGKEVALKFANNGYNVVMNYVSSKTNVEELKEEFESKGVKTLIMQADVTDKEAIEQLVKKAIEEFANDREAVVNVLEKYLKNKEKDAKTKQKAYRYLMSKGFMSEDINFIINKFFSGEEDYESWNWHNRNWKMFKIFGG